MKAEQVNYNSDPVNQTAIYHFNPIIAKQADYKS